MLAKVLSELDEIKRYVASTYSNTDNEISEIKSMCQKISRKLTETDAQVDKIEGFQRTLTDIRSSLKSMERKIR